VKINVAKSGGFCFGVKRAIKIALNTAKSGARVEVLGDIVHNEDVVKEINQVGVKQIKRLRKGDDKVLLIRAHGASEETYEKASRLGYTIVDATCPMVKEIHKIAKTSKQGSNEVIIIGDKEHDEVRGIMGQLHGGAVVIDNIKRIPLAKIKRIKRACVVVQSTQNLEKTLTIIEVLKRYIRELKFFNTICKPTRIKQKEAKEMPLKNDLMVIIGSKTSANTKRLYQISKSLNKRSYWVQSRDEIKPEWFRNVQSVGVMSGASTPDYTTKDVIEYIKSI
jgi:4-hydroxy-3-methylbut-2-enyl diphosphate reductase